MVAHLAKLLVLLPVSERFVRVKVKELTEGVIHRLPENGQFTLYAPQVEKDILQPVREYVHTRISVATLTLISLAFLCSPIGWRTARWPSSEQTPQSLPTWPSSTDSLKL